MTLEATIKEILEKQDKETALNGALLKEIMHEDRRGQIEPHVVRQILSLANGKPVPIAKAMAALCKVFPRAYGIRRHTAREHGRVVRYIEGVKIGSTKTVLRWLCNRFRLRGRNNDHRRALMHYKQTNWKQYPIFERKIFEEWAIFGARPARIASKFGMDHPAVWAILTKHKAAAGIDTASKGSRL